MASHWAKSFFSAATVAAVALSTSVPVTAQEALKLKPGKNWTHRHSGISVPATLAGTPRTGGNAYAPDDLDVSLGFTVGDAFESMSIYVFRNTNGTAPLWFAQAQWGIENRDVFGKPKLSLAPQPFVPPGQSTASGLKAIYVPQDGPYLSTGVILFPVGSWYVKLRASSQSRSPEQLAAWLDTALAEIEWPRGIESGAAAVPVAKCTEPLTFPIEAKDAPKNGSADLIAGVLGMMTGKGEIEETTASKTSALTDRWCHDSNQGGNQAVYRRNAATDAYLLAVGDNGNGIWVGPDGSAALLATANTKGEEDATPRFSIALHMAGQTINYVAQDRLPSPQRVIDIVERGRSTTTVPTWGKNKSINLNSDNL